jgi:hypothetical protein
MSLIWKTVRNSSKIMLNSINIDKNFQWFVRGDLKMLKILRNPENYKNIQDFEEFPEISDLGFS